MVFIDLLETGAYSHWLIGRPPLRSKGSIQFSWVQFRKEWEKPRKKRWTSSSLFGLFVIYFISKHLMQLSLCQDQHLYLLNLFSDYRAFFLNHFEAGTIFASCFINWSDNPNWDQTPANFKSSTVARQQSALSSFINPADHQNFSCIWL